MKRSQNILVLCLGMLLVFACAARESKDTSETRAVPAFHARYDHSDFEAIYRDATDEFRGSMSKDEYLKFMSTVRRKLGSVKSSKRQTWNVNVTMTGTNVTLTFETEFERGKGTETFSFVDRGDGPKLIGYRINSNALIMG